MLFKKELNKCTQTYNTTVSNSEESFELVLLWGRGRGRGVGEEGRQGEMGGGQGGVMWLFTLSDAVIGSQYFNDAIAYSGGKGHSGVELCKLHRETTPVIYHSAATIGCWKYARCWLVEKLLDLPPYPVFPPLFLFLPLPFPFPHLPSLAFTGC